MDSNDFQYCHSSGLALKASNIAAFWVSIRYISSGILEIQPHMTHMYDFSSHFGEDSLILSHIKKTLRVMSMKIVLLGYIKKMGKPKCGLSFNFRNVCQQYCNDVK